jgi:hypothetical protein
MTKGFLNDDFNAPGDITAGGIENTPIGNTTASTIEGTTGQFSSNVQIDGNILDSNGNEAIGLASTTSAVNYVNIVNSATLNGLSVEAAGGDTNIDVNLKSKGTGKTRLHTNGNVGLSIDSNGIVTMPLQSCFLANLQTDDSNVTGTGTLATISYSTEIVDRNNDYNGTTTYTCPSTALVQLNSSVFAKSITAAATNYGLRIVTSNRTYRMLRGETAEDAAGGQRAASMSMACDMDSADTASTQITISGEASDVVDIAGSTISTFFSGWLLG